MSKRLPRTSQAVRPDPDFPKVDYSYLTKLNAVQWYKELSRIYRDFLALGIDGTPKFRTILPLGNRGEGGFIHIQEAIIELKERISDGLHVNQNRLPALIVYLDAPDDAIISAIKKTLLELPSRHPDHMKKRGPLAPNSRFDTGQFKKWIDAHLVPLADLFIWNAREKAYGREPYPDHQLGAMLGLSPPTTSVRKKRLRSVLANMESLKAQVESTEIKVRD